jgi:hypothetical protein
MYSVMPAPVIISIQVHVQSCIATCFRSINSVLFASRLFLPIALQVLLLSS